MSDGGAGASGPGAPDPAALERALAALGVRARVEADGRVALVDAPPAVFAPADVRDAVQRLARAAGFTHAAVLLAAAGGAGSAGAAGGGAEGARRSTDA